MPAEVNQSSRGPKVTVRVTVCPGWGRSRCGSCGPDRRGGVRDSGEQGDRRVRVELCRAETGECIRRGAAQGRGDLRLDPAAEGDIGSGPALGHAEFEFVPVVQ